MKVLGYFLRCMLAIAAVLLVSAFAPQMGPPRQAPGYIQDISCYHPFGDRIFFDADSAELRVDSTDLIKRAIEFLGKYPVEELLLEGHTDARGPDDYNLSLGLRRAGAAKATMTALGFPTERIRLVSYGEFRPAVLGEGPDVWAQNRRVVFVIGNYLGDPPEIPCGGDG